MTVYVVRSGDTLSGIAARHNTTVEEIKPLNPHIPNIDRIAPGMAVNMPGKGIVLPDTRMTGEIPWFQIAKGELGESELRGLQNNNPRIIEYHSTCTLKATNDETPWCSSFVNFCMVSVGIKGTASAAARSWLDWSGGSKVKSPREGCVTVLRRGEPWQGHVGFFVSESDSHVELLGGNQGNQVSIANYSRDRVLAHLLPD